MNTKKYEFIKKINGSHHNNSDPPSDTLVSTEPNQTFKISRKREASTMVEKAEKVLKLEVDVEPERVEVL